MSDAFDLHWDRGVDFYDMGNLAEAITEWREAVLLEPDHEDANNHLAYALSQSGRPQEALLVVREAVQHCLESAELHLRLGYYLLHEADKYESKDASRAGWQEAHQALQKSSGLQPENAFTLHLLGLTDWRLGQKRKAIELLKASIAADPSDIKTYFTLGEYQRRAFHWRGMVQTILAMNKRPASEEMDRYYARVYRFSQRFWLFSSIIGAAVVVLLWIRHRKTQH